MEQQDPPGCCDLVRGRLPGIVSCTTHGGMGDDTGEITCPAGRRPPDEAEAACWLQRALKWPERLAALHARLRQFGAPR